MALCLNQAYTYPPYLDVKLASSLPEVWTNPSRLPLLEQIPRTHLLVETRNPTCRHFSSVSPLKPFISKRKHQFKLGTLPLHRDPGPSHPSLRSLSTSKQGRHQLPPPQFVEGGRACCTLPPLLGPLRLPPYRQTHDSLRLIPRHCGVRQSQGNRALDDGGHGHS